MIGKGDAPMLDCVREKLMADPALAQERYSGRTLLHGAAAAGNLATVELLLRLGAAVNCEKGRFGHAAPGEGL